LQLQNCTTTATYDVTDVVAAAKDEEVKEEVEEVEEDDDAKQLQRRFP